MSVYESATREEIVNIPIQRQIALFRAFSDEKKIQLWQQKHQIIMLSDEYTIDEKNKLSDIYSFLNKDFYSPSITKDFILFCEQWEKEMVERFNWTNEDIYFAVCTWMTKEEYLIAVSLESPIATKGIIIPSHDQKPDCNCNGSIECIGQVGGDVCYKKNESCNAVEACGYMGRFTCSGICK